eukprot:snap_masked-scaffold_4-processed-gene-1.18-mRNA-1 protein AED:1.00 eAED:1.00 QI:0/-1/0/0/-1/1/1/0/782
MTQNNPNLPSLNLQETEDDPDFAPPLKRLDSIGSVIEKFHQMRMNSDFDEATMRDLATPTETRSPSDVLEKSFPAFSPTSPVIDPPLASPRRHSTIETKDPKNLGSTSERREFLDMDQPAGGLNLSGRNDFKESLLAVPPGFQRNRFNSRSHGSANTLGAVGSGIRPVKASLLPIGETTGGFDQVDTSFDTGSKASSSQLLDRRRVTFGVELKKRMEPVRASKLFFDDHDFKSPTSHHFKTSSLDFFQSENSQGKNLGGLDSFQPYEQFNSHLDSPSIQPMGGIGLGSEQIGQTHNHFEPKAPSQMQFNQFQPSSPVHGNFFDVGQMSGMNPPSSVGQNYMQGMRNVPNFYPNSQQMGFKGQNQRYQGFNYGVPQGNFFPQQSQQGFNVPMNASKVLQEYRSTGVRPTTEALLGHIVEFSKDSHGSRFIQYKMENSSDGEKNLMIKEVLDDIVDLAGHPFGNYVVQNFLLYATNEDKFELAERFKGNLTKLSTQTHGCRVVQSAFDIVSLPQRNMLIKEIVEHIEHISKNNHGTHVVQKMMKFILDETIEASKRVKKSADDQCRAEGAPTSDEILGEIEKTVAKDLLNFCIHPHSYRLVQQTLANCDENRSEALRDILREIAKKQWALAVDQHGNFILQHLLDHGSVEQADQVQEFVASRVLELSQHKFGSHLVEKCLQKGTRSQAKEIVRQFLNPENTNKKYFDGYLMNQKKQPNDLALQMTPLLMLSKDPYGNFVVQKAFDASSGEERNALVMELRRMADILSRFTYGRHILSHLNSADN